MPKKQKQTDEMNVSLIVKRSIVTLIIVFFAILFFLLLLPKEPDIIKGVTYDLKYPRKSHYSQVPSEVIEKDFRLIKEAGINTIRIYGVPPEFILDLADKYGIKVIETVVFPGDWTDFTSPYQLQALKREAVRNVRRDMDRECIYAWSIWNDAPWTYGSVRGDVIKAYGKEKVTYFLRELYQAVKKQDPLRPVTAATLTTDEDAKRLGTDFLDILGYNTYLGITDWQTGHYDSERAEGMVGELVSISREYNKPVLITETGYSTFWKGEQQENVIRDQIEKVDRNLKGIILFQWADDWSKAGDVTVHNDNVEEHWGILEGERRPKGGYYATKQMYRNTLFSSIMFAISDYCRGGYFAAKKRALAKAWKEDIIVDKNMEDLQNQLSLRASTEEVPAILSELSMKFFEKKGFDQFASYLVEYQAMHRESDYKGLIDYYIALAAWNKLEYLARAREWELYYAEKARNLDMILDRLQRAEEATKGTDSYLAVLYLEWVIQNDILIGKENSALTKLEEAIKSHSESARNPAPLIYYSKLLKEQGEAQVSEKLLREYAGNIGRFVDVDRSTALLKKEAEAALASGAVDRAIILYNAYLSIIIRNYSEEDASFEMLELANTYSRQSLFDESIDVYERLLKEFPNSELTDDAAYAVAAVLKDKKSYSKAIKAFHDFVVKFPDSELSKSAIKEALSIFAIYGKVPRAEKTVSFLKEVIALYPESSFSIMARFELASSLAFLGRTEDARREYQYIIDNYPDSEYAGYSKGDIEQLGMEE